MQRPLLVFLHLLENSYGKHLTIWISILSLQIYTILLEESLKGTFMLIKAYSEARESLLYLSIQEFHPFQDFQTVPLMSSNHTKQLQKKRAQKIIINKKHHTAPQTQKKSRPQKNIQKNTKHKLSLLPF